MHSEHRLQASRRLALLVGLFVLTFAAQAVMVNTVAAAGAGTWTPAGDMLVARRDHTATLLSNGKVLIVGWFTNTAELYDPLTNAFAATGNTLDAHGQGSTATRLPDGKVLIVGGNGAPTSAELFDPATGVFSRAGSPSSPRVFHTATALSDGRVLVAGGPGNSAEIYAPATNRFTTTGGMNSSRTGAAAARLPDGSVLIAGGANDAAACLATAELFNPVTGIFSLTGSLVGVGCTLWWNQIVVLPSGRVFVVGGSDQANIFDPGSGTFRVTSGHMSVQRTAAAAILLSSGAVLVAGGSIAAGPIDTNSADLYDPTNDTFTPTASMSTPRQQFTITRLLNGHVLVTGGFTAVEDHTRTAEIFSALQDQTISFAPLVDRILGEPPFGVTATASSGLIVSLAASGPCSVSGSIVSVSGLGVCTITATQAGNASFNAAPTVSQSFNVLSPAQFAEDVIKAISGIGLPSGTSNSLTSKLEAYIASSASGNQTAACGQLGALVNYVNAQSGKLVPAADAALLLTDAGRLSASSDC